MPAFIQTLAERFLAAHSVRLAAFTVICAIVMALTVACQPAAPPTHYGKCPAGQDWKDPSRSPYGWECVR